MFRRTPYAILKAATCLGLTFLTFPLAGQEVDPYQQGREWQEVGSWEAALDVWEAAADSLFFLGEADPRLGIAAIELATDEGLTWRYGSASEAYLKSFLTDDMETHLRVIEGEVRRIQPILPPLRSQQWDALLEARDPQLLLDVRRFWIERDPTPTSPENEKLVEHWERIAHSRRTFRYGSNSPYRTDDRGTIYVKYGEASRIRSGNLGSDGSEMRRWILDRAERERLMRLDTNPQYEVWVYDNLNPNDFVFFLFGSVGGTGPFELVRGVRDLMPDAALSPNSRRNTPGGIRASHYFELFYYADLAALGGFFARRYSTLEQIWGQYESRSIAYDAQPVPPEGSLEALSFQYSQEDDVAHNNPFRRSFFVEVSDLADAGRSTEVVAHQTRILSPENEPQVIITALSAPVARLGLESRPRDAQGVDVTERGVRHLLIVRDSTLEEAGLLEGSRLYFGEDGISTFNLRYANEPLHFTLVAEVAAGGNQSGTSTSRFPGKMSFDLRPALVANPDSLEMSDLVLGFEPFEGINPALLPFPVVPAKALWRGDPAQAYLEVYHLAVRDGLARFTAEFRITPWDPRQDAPQRGAESTSLSFNLESDAPTSRHVFGLGIENLPSGFYEVRVQILDLNSGQTRSRGSVVEVGEIRRGRPRGQ